MNQQPSQGVSPACRGRAMQEYRPAMRRDRFASFLSLTQALGLLLLLLPALPLRAQGGKTDPATALLAGFRAHIGYLASDELGGRQPGTDGGEAAARYIESQFSQIGLTAAGDPGKFTQQFEMTQEVQYPTRILSGWNEKAPADLIPLPISTPAQVQAQAVYAGPGIQDPAIHRDDYAGKDVKGRIVVLDVEIPAELSNSPHGEVWNGYTQRTETAYKLGAAAVIFATPSPVERPSAHWKRGLTHPGIPALWIGNIPAEALNGRQMSFTMTTDTLTCQYKNVSAIWNNGAPWTLVFGAHYDHLGMGEEGSLHRGEPGIHNGADDNASGVAMLIELARHLSLEGPKTLNYQFIAFDGEERGLLGSNYYCKHPTQPLGTVTAMINMDMVGRLDPAENKVLLHGAGTSPAWNQMLGRITGLPITWKTSESGVGPSDHTSFYLKDLPVLHVFSGTEPDYHKPSDDADKINYEGMGMIYDLLVRLTQEIATQGKLTFTKTQDSNSEDAPRFTVTLGVVPDYAFEGTGMRIDGVSDGKPAALAGMRAGDVVIRMGEHEVRDMMGYMRALSKFKKGDKTTVIAQRGKKKKKFKVTF